MKKIKISAVSYLNTIPFVFGLQNSKIINEIDLSLDIPADCAKKLIEGKTDIALVPVAILPQIENYKIISNYCIGAEKEVKSVMLFSETKLENISTIFLDYQSLTSINLVKILAKYFWKINVDYKNTLAGFESQVIKKSEAAVIIGDRAFQFFDRYKYKYDLALEWNKFTNLPFVFAVWAAKSKLDKSFEEEFNKSLEFGINNIADAIKSINKKSYNIPDIKNYLTNNISYIFEDRKKTGLQLFFKYLKDLA